jgi:hypothetical protein
VFLLAYLKKRRLRLEALSRLDDEGEIPPPG